MRNIIILITILISQMGYSQVTFLGSQPAHLESNVPFSSNIILNFSDSIDAISINSGSILVHGSISGLVAGTYIGGGTTAITFNPIEPLEVNEFILVSINEGLTSNGVPLDNPTTIYFVTGVSQPIDPPNSEHTTFNLDVSGPGLEPLAFGDIDGDGDIDILINEDQEGFVHWLEYDDVIFPQFIKHTVISNASFNSSVDLADMDSDGDLDILLTQGGFIDALSWYENDGTSNPSFIRHTIIAGSGNSLHVVVGDLDNDGDLDIGSNGSSESNTLGWFENLGGSNPSFEEHQIPTSFVAPVNIALADMQGDGYLDLVASSRIADGIWWYANDGNTNPNFTELLVTSTESPRNILAVDIDNDLDLDIVSLSPDTNSILWHENNDALNSDFTTHIVSNDLTFPFGIATGDLDGDGDLDIGATAFEDDEVYWFENDGNGDPTFDPILMNNEIQYPRELHFVDMNKDEAIDVVFTSWLDPTGDVFLMLGTTILSLEENQKKLANVELSPNPVNDIVKLLNPSNIIIDDISLFDLQGRNLGRLAIPSNTLGTLNLPNNISTGTYLINIRSKNILRTLKLVIE